MKVPQTSFELKKEIELSENQKGDLRVRQLINILQKVDDEIISDGVFLTIQDKSNGFNVQKIASRILKELKPKSKKSSKQILFEILDNWDKSCQEVPFWFLDQYGKQELANTLVEIENNGITQKQSEKIKTVRWWLKIQS
ncbi:hypothetical protein [Flammeovirga aprica]|uniref:Uncharacterized protein n=1 Tax=Flammeovirga aprica JL-4 TaxID=694437 RepID=A0A7X9XCK7_9BACT|nr:hypothetical protein [Flammeovirga aprica]NME71936.1 hypothetical protein [Flammeovirga aprica JL-4]